jgi:hypothetical protein
MHLCRFSAPQRTRSRDANWARVNVPIVCILVWVVRNYRPFHDFDPAEDTLTRLLVIDYS